MLRLRCGFRLLQASRAQPGSCGRLVGFVQPQRHRSLLTLAIETSCDDTAVAILSRTPDGTTKLLFNERQSSDNRAFKGIEPITTIEGHATLLGPLVRKALDFLPDYVPPQVEVVPGAGDGEQGKQALTSSQQRQKQVPDFVAVTRGPGMRSNLGIGLSTAKGLAVAWGVPLVGVHHMQAHALTPRLVRALGGKMAGEAEDGGDTTATASGPDLPFLSLLVSGGHTQLVHSVSLTDHRIVANTVDVAVGNMLDQTARVILPNEILEASPDVMYGRLLESFALDESTPDEGSQEAGTETSTGSEHHGTGQEEHNLYPWFRPARSRADEIADVRSGHPWTISLPFHGTRKLAYAFSSIYTQVHAIAASSPSMPLPERRSLARHTMRAAFQHIAGRICLALDDKPELRAVRTLVVAGGVASNRFLMHVLRSTLEARGYGGIKVVAPPVELCTDNAAMIAWAGMEMYEAGHCSDLSITPIPKWPMDPHQGPGILGVEGWLRRDGFQ